jgi:hypothetical protein
MSQLRVRGYAPLPLAAGRIRPAQGEAAALPGIELLRGGRWWTWQQTMAVALAPGSVHWARRIRLAAARWRPRPGPRGPS